MFHTVSMYGCPENVMRIHQKTVYIDYLTYVPVTTLKNLDSQCGWDLTTDCETKFPKLPQQNKTKHMFIKKYHKVKGQVTKWENFATPTNDKGLVSLSLFLFHHTHTHMCL